MRGVEIGSIGRGISVAPSISRGASAGFRIGGFPAPKMEIGIRNIANPFLSKGSVVEAKVSPQTISVVETGLPSGQEAVDIAEQWLRVSSQPQNNHYILGREHNEKSRQRVIEPIIRPKNFVWARPEVLPFLPPETVVKPQNESKIQSKTGQIEFSKSAPSSGGLRILDKKVVQPRLNRGQENVVEQNLEEEVLTKKKVDEKSQVLEAEEVEVLKLRDVLDEEVAEQRVFEISEAIDLAQAEAKKEGVDQIEGPRIIKFLRLHIGLISRIARKIRKDGSLDETLEDLAARRFSSKNQAKQQTRQLVFEKEPVKKGKEGKAVKEGALERVFKYHFIKRSPKDEVVTRIVKKSAQPLAIESKVSKELKVEDYPESVGQALRPAEFESGT